MKISRNLLIIAMEESLTALLAKLHNEWKERISADEEDQQVKKSQNSVSMNGLIFNPFLLYIGQNKHSR